MKILNGFVWAILPESACRRYHEDRLRRPDCHGLLTVRVPVTGIQASYPTARSIRVGQKHGIDITDQRARQFHPDDFDRFDRIFRHGCKQQE
jgi:hypothetical protein